MRVRSLLLGLTGLLGLAGLAGCSEEVNPIIGTDLPYTFYGVLSPERDTQWVRVFPIEQRLQPSPPVPLGAVVRSVDLATGEGLAWHDTLLAAPDVGRAEAYGYFYWAAFTPGYGHAYRIEVTRPDGVTAAAVARVPERSELEALPPTSSQTTTAYVVVRGGAAHFLNVRVLYDIQYGRSANTGLRLASRYDGREERVEGGWRFGIDLAADRAAIETYLRANRLYEPSFGVLLHQLTLSLLVADPAWDPPGDAHDFDPNVLVDPGTMTNVENGFGFVGAGYRLSKTWLPDSLMLVRAGFILADDPAAAPF